MTNRKLKPCPFCGFVDDVKLKEYYESIDGRGDRPAMITCKCGVEMTLTHDEFKELEERSNFRGGYYSQNKKLWNGMHNKLVDKWNSREAEKDDK